MTAQEIQELHPDSRTTNRWLQEIACQLALLNERKPESEPEPVKRGPGRPTKVRHDG